MRCIKTGANALLEPYGMCVRCDVYADREEMESGSTLTDTHILRISHETFDKLEPLHFIVYSVPLWWDRGKQDQVATLVTDCIKHLSYEGA